AMDGIEPVQRELALGRLNLLAYARDDGPFTYITENNQLDEAGSILCTDVRPSRYGEPETPQNFGPDDRCAAFDFQLGPRDETPRSVVASATSERALLRLRAAEGHYERALQGDPNNLRARLGYAYVLDRLGRTSQARSQLRTIIKKGIPR